MCDCYGEPCKVCGEIFPLHLEDFATGRQEIMLVCDTCLKRLATSGNLGDTNLYRFLKTNPYVEWSFRQDDKRGRPSKRLRLYALTQNALDHRMENSPNTADHKTVGMQT